MLSLPDQDKRILLSEWRSHVIESSSSLSTTRHGIPSDTITEGETHLKEGRSPPLVTRFDFSKVIGLSGSWDPRIPEEQANKDQLMHGWAGEEAGARAGV